MGVILKRDALAAMLDDGPVLVALDASLAGVDVPSDWQGEEAMIIRIGWAMMPSIPDLTLATDTLSATLVFKGTPYHCVVPWAAVYSMRLEGTVHVANWPREVAVEFEVEPEPPKARHLKLVH